MMKTTKQCLLNIILFFFLMPIIGFSQSQPTSLQVPANYQNKFEPKHDHKFVFEVEEIFTSCLNIFGESNGQLSKIESGDTEFPVDEAVNVIAISRLFAIPSGTGEPYRFGNRCGEGNFNGADVFVNYANNPPSGIDFDGPTTTFNLNLEGSTFDAHDNNPREYEGQQYLRVNASETNTATISVNLQSEQGNVFINLIQASNGNSTLMALNPKGSGQQTFTTNEVVYVLPVIGPKFSTSNNMLIYEIGDPKRNAKIKVKEEIEEE